MLLLFLFLKDLFCGELWCFLTSKLLKLSKFDILGIVKFLMNLKLIFDFLNLLFKFISSFIKSSNISLQLLVNDLLFIQASLKVISKLSFLLNLQTTNINLSSEFHYFFLNLDNFIILINQSNSVREELGVHNSLLVEHSSKFNQFLLSTKFSFLKFLISVIISSDFIFQVLNLLGQFLDALVILLHLSHTILNKFKNWSVAGLSKF